MPTMREERLAELASAGLGEAGLAEAGAAEGGAGSDYAPELLRCQRCRTVYVLDPRFPHTH